MVADVATGDPTRLLCLNCARRTVSPRTSGKFDGLTGYLKFRGAFTDTVKLPFARIDGVIGDNLPIEAYRSESWWSNMPNVHSKGWLEAGWIVQEVNLAEGHVVFKKVREIPVKAAGGRGRGARQIKKPFTPVPVRAYKPKEPSKTKVSKLYARIKNVERRRTGLPTYHGSFKPKPSHEKRLFKSENKPE
jgi:hypothetical protein